MCYTLIQVLDNLATFLRKSESLRISAKKRPLSILLISQQTVLGNGGISIEDLSFHVSLNALLKHRGIRLVFRDADGSGRTKARFSSIHFQGPLTLHGENKTKTRSMKGIRFSTAFCMYTTLGLHLDPKKRRLHLLLCLVPALFLFCSRVVTFFQFRNSCSPQQDLCWQTLSSFPLFFHHRHPHTVSCLSHFVQKKRGVGGERFGSDTENPKCFSSLQLGCSSFTCSELPSSQRFLGHSAGG